MRCPRRCNPRRASRCPRCCNPACLAGVAWSQVPNLFPKDELVTLMELVTQRAKRAGKALTPQVPSLQQCCAAEGQSLRPA